MGKYLAPEKSSPAQDNNWSLIHVISGRKTAVEGCEEHGSGIRNYDPAGKRQAASLTAGPGDGRMNLERNNMENKTIQVTVQGGVVVDVKNLPEGWDLQIIDKDNEEN